MRKFTMMYTGLQVYSAEEVDAKLKEYDEDNLLLSQAASLLSDRCNSLETVIETQRQKIQELSEALREAMGWDWLTDAPPPAEIVAKCEKALGE